MLCTAILATNNAKARFTTALQGKFGGLNSLLESSSDTVLATHGMRETMLTIDDTIILVKTSDIHDRDAIVSSLLSIRSTGRTCVQLYQKYVTRIESAVNLIVLANNHTSTLIEQQLAPYSPLPVICSTFTDSFGIYICSDPRRKIHDAFTASLELFDSSICTLTHFNAATDQCLNDLDSQLTSVGDLIGFGAAGTRRILDEILSSIWTRLGGNRGYLAQVRSQHRIYVGAEDQTKMMRMQVWDGQRELFDLQESSDALRSMATTPLISKGLLPPATVMQALSDGSKALKARMSNRHQGAIAVV